eukprot:436687_1
MTAMLRTVRKSNRSFAQRFFHRQSSTNAVLCGAVRTPIGSFQGALSSFSATELGTFAIKGSLEKSGLDPNEIGEVFMGNVISANLGQAPARQAALRAGIPNSAPCTTVNKVCASGMKSIMFAAQSIMLGHQTACIAGGMESMSNAPFYLPQQRTGIKFGHGQVLDGLMKDGLWDAFDDHAMGMCAEHCADTNGISRADQDEYTIRSYTKAREANESGAFSNELIPVSVPQRKGDPILFDHDEDYKNIKFDKVPTLRPAFKKGGSVTAANSSTLSDGAAAMIVTSEEFAKEKGLKPIARIKAFADAARAPLEFPVAPVNAVQLALKRAGVSVNDIDFWEINEAFAVVPLADGKLLNIDMDRVNIRGGAVSLGHPIGASGARIVATLAHILRDKDASLGVAAICNGGGGASAVVLERI